MTRLPQIGDSVRRVLTDGKIDFDGYVAGSRIPQPGEPPIFGPDVNLVSKDAIDFLKAHGGFVALHNAPKDMQLVKLPLLFLVRGLRGWRWAPYDGRPQVGDVLLERLCYGSLGPMEGEPATRWLILNVEADHRVTLALVRLDGKFPQASNASGDQRVLWDVLPRAIAGLDGWSWEPARWSAP